MFFYLKPLLKIWNLLREKNFFLIFSFKKEENYATVVLKRLSCEKFAQSFKNYQKIMLNFALLRKIRSNLKNALNWIQILPAKLSKIIVSFIKINEIGSMFTIYV